MRFSDYLKVHYKRQFERFIKDDMGMSRSVAQLIVSAVSDEAIAKSLPVRRKVMAHINAWKRRGLGL